MKLKNNSIGPKVIHYVSTNGGRKAISIESNGTIEIKDCEKIINQFEIENKWVSIVDETNIVVEKTKSPIEKMVKASKDVDSYMSDSEEKITKAKTK